MFRQGSAARKASSNNDLILKFVIHTEKWRRIISPQHFALDTIRDLGCPYVRTT